MTTGHFATGTTLGGITAALLGVIACFAGAYALARSSQQSTNLENSATPKPGQYYCNMKALSTGERYHHRLLTLKLMMIRKDVTERPDGYEFQFNSTAVSVAELADWVGNESKCCPFFDFHIGVERDASLLTLRLSGDEGIKAFIRAEFHLASL
jgi:hypothetical protein